MKRYIKLSYNIGVDTPLYPETPPVIIEKVKEISKGNSCNTSIINISSHTGTHIDVPRHFIDSGRAISDYSLEEFFFIRPLLIDCPKGIDEIIEIDDMTLLVDSPQTDILLIRTGFQEYRNRDVNTYCFRNPCLSTDAARWIRKNFPCIRGLGIDCISVSSGINRDMGRETHRILLTDNDFTGAPVLIFEDMFLPSEINDLDEVIVSPIFIEGLDGAPCTVVGIIED